jgi:acyl transferase domain-containing protein
VLFPRAGDEDAAADRLRDTALAQPALFATEYATARLWMEWGVRPAAMLGHSIGEYVAACLAGVWSLDDALALVAERGRLMGAMAPGLMLSVALPADDVRALLGSGLSLAADNAPRSCVVSGDAAAVGALEARLGADGVRHRRLHTSHAFHSHLVEPAVARLVARVERTERRAPSLPWVSNVTGAWITADEAADPAYWGRHLRGTVRFREGLAALADLPGTVLLECGPGQSLSALAEALDADAPCIASMRQPKEGGHDARHLAAALGRLWAEGVEIDWSGVWKHERRRRVLLPTYPFERTRHWIDAPSSSPSVAPAVSGDALPAGEPADARERVVVEQIRVMTHQLRALRDGLRTAAAPASPKPRRGR